MFIVFYHVGAVLDAIFDARIDRAHAAGVSGGVLQPVQVLHSEAPSSSVHAMRSAMDNRSHSPRMACDVYL
jgi:hypothetical protein